MFAETIIAGAREMGVQMSPEQARMFETYHEMLIQANAQFNLTRVADDMREAIRPELSGLHRAHRARIFARNCNRRRFRRRLSGHPARNHAAEHALHAAGRAGQAGEISPERYRRAEAECRMHSCALPKTPRAIRHCVKNLNAQSPALSRR